MYLNKAKFVLSMSKYVPELIEEIPQIAVVGKSNVGKSSFINCVTNNGKLCKVGQTPGKTRLINFFKAEDSFYLVDLPGYGYAKRSKKEILEWSAMIENYLSSSDKITHIILLVDIRHNPTNDDKSMLDWIIHYGIKPVIICTKAEKIAKTKRMNACRGIAGALEYSGEILPIDSVSGYGRDAIVELIKDLVPSKIINFSEGL